MLGGGGEGGCFKCRYDELVGLVVSFIASPGGAMFCRHYCTASAVPAEFLLVVSGCQRRRGLEGRFRTGKGVG